MPINQIGLIYRLKVLELDNRKFFSISSPIRIPQDFQSKLQMNKAIEHALALLNSSKLFYFIKNNIKNTELTLTNYQFGFKNSKCLQQTELKQKIMGVTKTHVRWQKSEQL